MEWFEGRLWKEEVNVRDFIQNNYISMRETRSSWQDRQRQPTVCGANFRSYRKQSVQKNGVLDMETEVVTSLTAYGPGYHR